MIMSFRLIRGSLFISLLTLSALAFLSIGELQAGAKGTAGTRSQSSTKKLMVTVNGVGIGLQEDGDGWGRGKGDIAILWNGHLVDNLNGVTQSSGSSADYGIITKVEGVGDGHPVNSFADIAHPMLTLQDDNICCDLGDYKIEYYTFDVDGSELFDIWASIQIATGYVLTLATENPAWAGAGEAVGAVYQQIGDLVEGLDPTGKRINYLPSPIACCLAGNNQGCSLDNDDALYLDAAENKYNGTIRNRWFVSSTGNCIKEIEDDEPIPFSGDIKTFITGQNGVGELNIRVGFPELRPLETPTQCVTIYLDTDNNPQTGTPCGPEKGADNFYKVCGPDTSLVQEYGWWDPSVTCHSTLIADFDQDVINAPPTLSLPGGATNDQLVLNESGGTVRVVSSSGNLVSKPLLLSKNAGAGTVGFSAYLCSGADCDTQTVAWSSLTKQTTNSTTISLLSSLGTTIATLQYGNSGQLLYNGVALPVSYTINVKNDFEIVVRFGAQLTDLKVNGAPVAGFQNRPFVQSSSDLSEFKCQLSGTTAQQFAIDNILACTKCGGWTTYSYAAMSAYIVNDTTAAGLSSLSVSLNPSHFYGVGSIDTLGVRVVSYNGGFGDDENMDFSPHQDSQMVMLPLVADSLSPIVSRHWVIGDTTTQVVSGVGVRFSEPVVIPGGSIHISPSIPFTTSCDAYRTLKINFSPSYGRYTITLDSTIRDGNNNRLSDFTITLPVMNKLVDTTVAERNSAGVVQSAFSKGDTIRIAANRALALPASSSFRAYVVHNDSAIIGKTLLDVTSDGYNIGSTDIGGRVALMSIGRLNQVGEFNTILDFDNDGVFDASDRPAHRAWLELYRSASVWTSEYCGDADGSGAISIADAVWLITYIFSGGASPDPLQLGDADGNGAVSIADAVYLINYIFASGPAPHCP